MEKIWNIDDKDFTNREEAREFLAIKWNKNPTRYINNEDFISYFNDYLDEHKRCSLNDWLLELANATETQLKEKQNFFKQSLAEFFDNIIDNVVDDWLVEEIEEE